MSLDIRSHLPLAVEATEENVAELGMQRIEVALLVAASGIAVALFSMVSVLVHLS